MGLRGGLWESWHPLVVVLVLLHLLLSPLMLLSLFVSFYPNFPNITLPLLLLLIDHFYNLLTLNLIKPPLFPKPTKPLMLLQPSINPLPLTLAKHTPHSKVINNMRGYQILLRLPFLYTILTLGAGFFQFAPVEHALIAEGVTIKE